MIRLLPAILALGLLGACSDPALYAGLSVTPNGVSVSPAAQGRVGGATITVSP